MKNLKATIEMTVMKNEQLKYGEKVIEDAWVLKGYQDDMEEFVSVVVDEKIHKTVKPNMKAKLEVKITSKINGKYLQDNIRAVKLITQNG